MTRIRMLLSATALVLTLAASGAQASLRIVEQAIETSTFSVSLPDGGTGSIALKACADCTPLLLRLTPQTQYLVGRSPVSYAEFLSLARGGTGRGLGVFYDAKERTITRLIMSGTRPATAPRRR